MFTPQEVREQSESFEKAVFGGYSVSAVDDFVGSLAEDYAVLYKENAVLKSKMKVLVERLEEYREQEDSLNKVMLSAQQSADELVQDAERKCAKMLSDTEASLRERNVDLKAGAGSGGRTRVPGQEDCRSLHCGDGKPGTSVPESAGANSADDHCAQGIRQAACHSEAGACA